MELFAAASRWMVVRGWLDQLFPFVVLLPFPSVEKRDKLSLPYISLKSLSIAFPLEKVCLYRSATILSKRLQLC